MACWTPHEPSALHERKALGLREGCESGGVCRMQNPSVHPQVPSLEDGRPTRVWGGMGGPLVGWKDLFQRSTASGPFMDVSQNCAPRFPYVSAHCGRSGSEASPRRMHLQFLSCYLDAPHKPLPGSAALRKEEEGESGCLSPPAPLFPPPLLHPFLCNYIQRTSRGVGGGAPK